MLTDEQLVQQVLNGDVNRFEELVIRHEKKIYSLAYRMMGNPEDANDAAQEAFLKAFRSLRSFKQRSKFSTWLYRITVNVCYDMLRKRKRNTTISLDEPLPGLEGEVTREIADESKNLEEQVGKKELLKVLGEAINQLPEEQRLIIVLRDVKGLSYKEIGSIISIPLGTVKSRLNRARATIRELLQENKELLPYALRLNK